MSKAKLQKKLLEKILIQHFLMINYLKYSSHYPLLEVPEGLEPSTFSSVARRSNPIELWDLNSKISKKNGFIKGFNAYCHSLNKNIIKRDYV